jgi:hypothetical protein
VVLRANMRPVIAKTRKTWKRRDVRTARKAHPAWPELYATVTAEIAAAVEAAERDRRTSAGLRIWVGFPGLGRRSPMLWEDR